MAVKDAVPLTYNGIPVVCQDQSHLFFSSPGERSFHGYVTGVSHADRGAAAGALDAYIANPELLKNCYESYIRTNFPDGSHLLSLGESYLEETGVSVPAVNPEDHNCYKVAFNGPGSSDMLALLRAVRKAEGFDTAMLKRVVSAVVVIRIGDHSLAGKLHKTLVDDLESGLSVADAFDRYVTSASGTGITCHAFPRMNGDYRIGDR